MQFYALAHEVYIKLLGQSQVIGKSYHNKPRHITVMFMSPWPAELCRFHVL